MQLRLLRLSLVCLCGLLLAACGGPAPPPFKPLADNKLLMQAMTDPAAVHVWASVGTIIDGAGARDFRPQNDAEWLAVRNAAVTVSESGNLMMMVPRAKDGGEWMRIAAAMVDKGSEIAQAAAAKNHEKVFTLGGDLYDICTNCHSKYNEAIVKANQ